MEKGLKICRLLAESERQIQEQAANVCGKKYVIKKWSPCHITSSLSGMTSTEIITQNLSQGENLIFTTTFTTTGADRVKIMIWDAADTQSQLTTATEIEL